MQLSEDVHIKRVILGFKASTPGGFDSDHPLIDTTILQPFGVMGASSANKLLLV
jgi:hypothetical protein